MDVGALEGIAINGYLTSNRGAWEFSTDGGANWTGLGVVDTANSLLLESTDRLRFVPDGENSEVAVLSLKAWDGTSGTAGAKVDSSTAGGISAFSTTNETVSINVTAVNDSPVLDNSGNTILDAIDEDDINSPGQTVAAILGSDSVDQISDVDVGASEGIAVVGVDDTNGVWQYSIDSGTSWLSFASNGVSAAGVDNSSAVLLSDSAQIRFVPNINFEGTPGELTYRGLGSNRYKSEWNSGCQCFVKWRQHCV